jgi:hypothetical protein
MRAVHRTLCSATLRRECRFLTAVFFFTSMLFLDYRHLVSFPKKAWLCALRNILHGCLDYHLVNKALARGQCAISGRRLRHSHSIPATHDAPITSYLKVASFAFAQSLGGGQARAPLKIRLSVQVGRLCTGQPIVTLAPTASVAYGDTGGGERLKERACLT